MSTRKGPGILNGEEVSVSPLQGGSQGEGQHKKKKEKGDKKRIPSWVRRGEGVRFRKVKTRDAGREGM